VARFFSFFPIKQKVYVQINMEHSQALAEEVNKYGCQGTGFRTTQMSQKYGTKQMGLTVYVQTNTKEVVLRQAIATSRQHQRLPNFNEDPQISKLPGGILAPPI